MTDGGANGAAIRGAHDHQLVAVIDDERPDLLDAATDIRAGLFGTIGLIADRIMVELAHRLTQL